jgi:hypothetical protein
MAERVPLGQVGTENSTSGTSTWASSTRTSESDPREPPTGPLAVFGLRRADVAAAVDGEAADRCTAGRVPSRGDAASRARICGISGTAGLT